MSKKASKTLIGVFVLGALALIVAGVVIFGGGRFFAPTKKFVMYFGGSVKGLQVGAPVMFRGVKIGEVTDIRLNFNPKDLSTEIPVVVEINTRLLNVPEEYRHLMGEKERYWLIKPLIEKGLKAQLQMQSFVTGLLMISLDFYPERPISLHGLNRDYPEIPTVPTTLEELTKTIEELPLREITENLNRTLEGIGALVRSPELKESISSLNQLLKNADTLVRNIDSRVGPLSASLTSTSDAARGAFAQAEKTLKMDEGVPGEIAASVKSTLKTATVTLDETRKAIEGVKRIAAQNENLGYEINRSLEEMKALARTLRSLADYLDRHPEAIIRGKTPPKGE